MFTPPEVVAMRGDGKQKEVLMRTSDGDFRLFRGALMGGSLSWGLVAIDRESALSFYQLSETKLVSELL